MNESIFLLHLALSVLFLLPIRSLKKEGLIAWVAALPILANLFVLKQITLLGFTVTASDVYAVSCALGLNLLQEYYGKDAAKQAIKISFTLLLFFVAMAYMHIFYVPASADFAHEAYKTILSTTPRLVLASITSFFCVQSFDLFFFGFLKEKATKLSLFTRNILSLSCSQFVDTLLFTILGLWGLVSELFDVFLVSFIVKLTIGLLLSLPTLRKQDYAPV